MPETIVIYNNYNNYVKCYKQLKQELISLSIRIHDEQQSTEKVTKRKYKI